MPGLNWRPINQGLTGLIEGKKYERQRKRERELDTLREYDQMLRSGYRPKDDTVMFDGQEWIRPQDIKPTAYETERQKQKAKYEYDVKRRPYKEQQAEDKRLLEQSGKIEERQYQTTKSAGEIDQRANNAMKKMFTERSYDSTTNAARASITAIRQASYKLNKALDALSKEEAWVDDDGIKIINEAKFRNLNTFANTVRLQTVSAMTAYEELERYNPDAKAPPDVVARFLAIVDKRTYNDWVEDLRKVYQPQVAQMILDEVPYWRRQLGITYIQHPPGVK